VQKRTKTEIRTSRRASVFICKNCSYDCAYLVYLLIVCLFQTTTFRKHQQTTVTITEIHKNYTHTREKLHIKRKRTRKKHCIQHIMTAIQHWNTFTTLHIRLQSCDEISFLHCAAQFHILAAYMIVRSSTVAVRNTTQNGFGIIFFFLFSRQSRNFTPLGRCLLERTSMLPRICKIQIQRKRF